MLEVEILGVSDGPQHPVVLLRHEDRILPIVVGIPEAHAISIGIMEEKLGRPMTHDLICNILAGFNAEVESIKNKPCLSSEYTTCKMNQTIP